MSVHSDLRLPRAHARFLQLPLLGGFLEGLVQWLAAQGFSPSPIRRRIRKALVLERMLTCRGIRDLGGLSQEQFLWPASQPARNQRNLSELVRSMTAFLAGNSLLRVVDPSPGELVARAYLRIRDRVGLPPQAQGLHVEARPSIRGSPTH